MILAERRGTLSEQCNKLRNGLTKLEEAREQVGFMLCWIIGVAYIRATKVTWFHDVFTVNTTAVSKPIDFAAGAKY